jgi:hypothetical protein
MVGGEERIMNGRPTTATQVRDGGGRSESKVFVFANRGHYKKYLIIKPPCPTYH